MQRSAPSKKRTTQGWDTQIYFKDILFSVEEPKGAVTVAGEGLGEGPAAVTLAPFHSRPLFPERLSTHPTPPYPLMRQQAHPTSPQDSPATFPHSTEPSSLPLNPPYLIRPPKLHQPAPRTSPPRHSPHTAAPAHRTYACLPAGLPALRCLPHDWLFAAWPRLPPVAIGPCARAAVRRGAGAVGGRATPALLLAGRRRPAG